MLAVLRIVLNHSHCMMLLFIISPQSNKRTMLTLQNKEETQPHLNIACT